MTKICTKCNIEKSSQDFYLSKRHKEGFGNECKACASNRCHKWYEVNKEKAKDNVIKWIKLNPDKVKQYRRQYKQNKGENALSQYHKNYRAANADHIREIKRKRKRDRLKTDLDFVIMQRLRRRMFMAFQRSGDVKSQSTYKLLGCSLIDFRKHIESQFNSGMTWDNWGTGFLLDNNGRAVRDENGNTVPIRQWHIDHIIPCVVFDLTDPEQQKKCFHYTNLQPLWATDNISKGVKLINQ